LSIEMANGREIREKGSGLDKERKKMCKRHVDPVFLASLCSRGESTRQGLEIGFGEGFGAVLEQEWSRIEADERKGD